MWQKPPTGKISSHFTWQEAACRHCGLITEPEEVRTTAAMMEAIRKKLGNRVIHVHSWCRCPEHNAAVGGVNGSFHMRGMAVDFTVKTLSPRQVQQRLKAHDGGLGQYVGFTHVDTGPKRRWRE